MVKDLKVGIRDDGLTDRLRWFGFWRTGARFAALCIGVGLSMVFNTSIEALGYNPDEEVLRGTCCWLCGRDGLCGDLLCSAGLAAIRYGLGL